MIVMIIMMITIIIMRKIYETVLMLMILTLW